MNPLTKLTLPMKAQFELLRSLRVKPRPDRSFGDGWGEDFRKKKSFEKKTLTIQFDQVVNLTNQNLAKN